MTTRVLTTGLAMGESPRWHDGVLWVCDWLAGEVVTVDSQGHTAVVRRVEGLPFSVDWLPGEESRSGVAAVVTPDGATREVADDLWFPNGMAVTPDGSMLIVAESHAHRLTAFTIAADASLTHRRTWAELGGDAAPDGICLDADGAVWYADVPNRHCRRVAEGGRVLETVEVDRGCFACMLGGPDGRLLHIVATDWERLDWQHGGGDRTGQVLTYLAPAPHAGRP